MSDKTTLSFVDTTKPEKKFNLDAYHAHIKGLSFADFLSTPYDEEKCPLQITLDTPHNPVSRGQFDTNYIDKYTSVRINSFGQGGYTRVYLKDVDAIIEALTKIKDGCAAMREAGTRDFPKIAGYEEWLATQNNDNVCVCEATALN